MAEWYLNQVKNNNKKSSEKMKKENAGPIVRIHVSCENCGKTLAVPKGRAGTIKCPVCDRGFHVDTRQMS
jgi:hypothetical protein